MANISVAPSSSGIALWVPCVCSPMKKASTFFWRSLAQRRFAPPCCVTSPEGKREPLRDHESAGSLVGLPDSLLGWQVTSHMRNYLL